MIALYPMKDQPSVFIHHYYCAAGGCNDCMNIKHVNPHMPAPTTPPLLTHNGTQSSWKIAVFMLWLVAIICTSQPVFIPHWLHISM